MKYLFLLWYHSLFILKKQIMFYRNFFKGHKVSERSSWDLIAVLYAVRGLSEYFTMAANGKSVSQKDGTNQWIPGPASNHAYLIATMNNTELAKVIEDLLITPTAAITVPRNASKSCR